MAEFNIITWLKNRVGYDIPKGTLENIVLERGLRDVSDYADLSEKDKDVLLADLLFYLWTCPTQTASKSWSHGDQKRSIGSQMMTDKNNIHDLMMSLYRKWGDPKAEMVEDSGGYVQWVNEF